MEGNQEQRIRKAVLLGALSGIFISLITLIACVVLYFWFLSNVGFPLIPLIPQDCELISVSIHGQVQDVQNRPIGGAKITVTDNFPAYGHPVNLTLKTDNYGKFEQENIDVFRCEDFIITASANGFLPKQVKYFVDPSVQLSDSLPQNIFLMLNSTSSVLF